VDFLSLNTSEEIGDSFACASGLNDPRLFGVATSVMIWGEPVALESSSREAT
jgi:hypothetical protein